MSYGKAEGLRVEFFVQLLGDVENLLADQVNQFFEENPDAEILDIRFLDSPTEQVKEGALLYCPTAWVVYRIATDEPRGVVRFLE